MNSQLLEVVGEGTPDLIDLNFGLMGHPTAPGAGKLRPGSNGENKGSKREIRLE